MYFSFSVEHHYVFFVIYFIYNNYLMNLFFSGDPLYLFSICLLPSQCWIACNLQEDSLAPAAVRQTNKWKAEMEWTAE